MIEMEVLGVLNDLLDRCEMMLVSETTSPNSSELGMKSHCHLMHHISCDVSSTELIIEENYKKLSQKEKVDSHSNLLIKKQVSSDVLINFAEIIQDESNENKSISYSPCEGLLFSDSESEDSKIITEEINNISENFKPSTHKQSLDPDNFPLFSNQLMINNNVSQISNFKEVSSESDLLNSCVHEKSYFLGKRKPLFIQSPATIKDVQEIKGKKLENCKIEWNGYDNQSLPEDTMKIILPDVQNAIKLCTGNSTNKNIDLLGQVKNEYSVKALVEETDCCNITSIIQSETQHEEQGDINLETELSNINGMDSKALVINAELDTNQEIENPDNTVHCTNESSKFEEVVSKTFSVKAITDGYLDDISCEVSSEQIVSNASNSNYHLLFDKSIKNTEEISDNVLVNEKQEIEALNDVKVPLYSKHESSNSTDLKRTEENFEEHKEPIFKYEIDTSAGNVEQLLIDSQNVGINKGCKKAEIDSESKAVDSDQQPKAVSIEDENKSSLEPKESLEQLNNDNGIKHCQEVNFADQKVKLSVNGVQTTLNNKSFMKETELNEKLRGEKLSTSSERNNCKKNECAWNNAEWKINDTLADKESCTKVNIYSDILKAKSEMKLNSVEMFHKNVDIFHDNEISILENSLFDGQNTDREQGLIAYDSNSQHISLKSSSKHLSDNGTDVENDSKVMNTNSDINVQNSQEYISCAQGAFQDISQSAISSNSTELTSGDQDNENKSSEILNDLFKSPLLHFSQVAEEDTSRETTVVKSDVYRSDVETPDAYIDLDEDLDDILMYPATQYFKPSIPSLEVNGDRSETTQVYQSDNMNEFELNDVNVPDINYKRNISQVYSRNQDSVIKKSRKENALLMSNPCFKWNKTVPEDITGEEVSSMKSLVTCPRPLRLGLSKKQKTKTLHKN